MGTESARATDGELLAHAEWVKRIAAALVGSAGEADDLVQETWLAALRRPPAADRPLRPWLARVVRNFTFRARRSSARRLQTEREAARHEALPSSDAVAERLELERLLAEALGSLEEPYRSTVVLRYLDGRSAADIAAEQGIPAGTVRWRLKVGLDELRSRLDRRYGGDRCAWSGAMFALAHPNGAPPAVSAARPGFSMSALVPHVLAMNTLLKLACAAAIAVVAAVGFLALKPSSGPAPDPLGPVAAAAPSGDPAAPAAMAPESQGLLASERREVRAEPTPDAREPAAALADAEPPAVVEARLIDDQGRPLHRGELLLRGRADPVSSAADGRVRIEVELEQPTWTGTCEARCTGYASVFLYVALERGRTTLLGELVLGPGGSASGVVLGPEGRPFEGAHVLVTGPGMDGTVESTRRRGPNTWPGAPSGRSGPDGTFRVEGVTPGAVRVWAGVPGLRYAMTPPLELGAGEELSGLVLELEELQRDERIEGTVLDPAGVPVPQAEISYAYQAGGIAEAGSIQSDESGRFRLLLGAIAPHDLTARDPGGRWLDAVRPQVPPGTLDLALAFEEARWLDLRARPAGRSRDALRRRAAPSAGRQGRHG